MKNILNIIFIFSCFTLTACQSTSIRTLSADKEINAKPEFEQTSKQNLSDFEPPQANQLRMYIFTGFEHEDDQEGRDGYFVDFSVSAAATNNPQ